MTDDKQRLENAKWLFERTLSWIATADVKVGVATAFDTAMLGGLAAAFGSSDPSARTAWTYLFVLSAAGGMCIAMFCAGMAAIPRMLGPVASMVFFGRVSEKKEADYVSEFRRMSEQWFIDDIATQIHRNSQIATEKHRWLRKSLIWSFVSAIPWVLAIGTLVKT